MRRERFYLLASPITTTQYRQTQKIDLNDVDTEKFLDCQDSPMVGLAYNQYGVTEDISKVLYSKVPLSSETQTDDMLKGTKYLTDLTKVYKKVKVKKEIANAMIYYIIAVDEVDG